MRPIFNTVLVVLTLACTPVFVSGALAAPSTVSGPPDSEMVYRANLGRADDIELLIKQGGSLNSVDNNGVGLLFLAASRKDEEALNMVHTLMAHGLPVNSRDPSGKTPLFYAAKVGNNKVVQFLLDNGADMNLADRSGEYARSYAYRAGHPDTMTLMDNYARKKVEDINNQYVLLNKQLEERYKKIQEDEKPKSKPKPVAAPAAQPAPAAVQTYPQPQNPLPQNNSTPVPAAAPQPAPVAAQTNPQPQNPLPQNPPTPVPAAAPQPAPAAVQTYPQPQNPPPPNNPPLQSQAAPAPEPVDEVDEAAALPEPTPNPEDVRAKEIAEQISRKLNDIAVEKDLKARIAQEARETAPKPAPLPKATPNAEDVRAQKIAEQISKKLNETDVENDIKSRIAQEAQATELAEKNLKQSQLNEQIQRLNAEEKAKRDARINAEKNAAEEKANQLNDRLYDLQMQNYLKAEVDAEAAALRIEQEEQAQKDPAIRKARIAERLKKEAEIEKIFRDFAYNNCSFQYWYYCYTSGLTTELKSEQLNDAIDASKNKVVDIQDTLQNDYDVPANDLKKVGTSAKKRVFDQLDKMQSSRQRRSVGVGNVSDMQKRCNDISINWNILAGAVIDERKAAAGPDNSLGSPGNIMPQNNSIKKQEN